MKILVHGAEEMAQVPGLETVGTDTEIGFAPDEASLGQGLPGTDILLGWDFRGRDLANQWDHADSLKWIHWGGAGVDAVLFPALADSDVVLTNSRGLFDRAMAEYVLGYMLAEVKGFRTTLRSQDQSEWNYRGTVKLAGSKAAVFGVGSIGREIATLLKAVDVEVTGVGRSERGRRSGVRNDPRSGRRAGCGRRSRLGDRRAAGYCGDGRVFQRPVFRRHEAVRPVHQCGTRKRRRRKRTDGRAPVRRHSEGPGALPWRWHTRRPTQTASVSWSCAEFSRSGARKSSGSIREAAARSFRRPGRIIWPRSRRMSAAIWWPHITNVSRGEDRTVQVEAARAWSMWEGSTISLFPDSGRVARFGRDEYAVAFARIECHYFINGGFLERDDQLIANADRIRHIPGVIVQGRYDVVTPATSAWELSQAWPEAELRIVADAGHAVSEPGIASELVSATRQVSLEIRPSPVRSAALSGDVREWFSCQAQFRDGCAKPGARRRTGVRWIGV